MRLRQLHKPADAVLAASTKALAAVSATPAAGASLKDRYPCTVCNKLGHWRDDNKCSLADVRANLGRLSTLIVPRIQLAIAGPSGSSGKRELNVFVV